MRARGTDGGCIIVGADEGETTEGGVGEYSAVVGQTAAQAFSAEVAEVAVVGARFAGSCVLVFDKPGQAGLVAEVVVPQVVVEEAGGAEKLRTAVLAAGGALDADLFFEIKVILFG